MQVGMVGLGRMGMNMAKRLLRGEHGVIAYNRSPEKVKEISAAGAGEAYSLRQMVEKLAPPRVIWLMLPAGPVVDEHIEQFKEMLAPGDILVDGGNTHYKDDLRRSQTLAEKDILFADVGVSGGVWGLQIGYCLMVGGGRETFRALEPLLKTLAPPEGYLYCGETGSGHFVKMVHNGIEYGMMQAYAEGFQILEASPYAQSLDYASLAHLWNQGSVIRSWLLELAETAFGRDGRLSGIQGDVADSGEGRWTVQQAIETGVSAPVIALSLMRRFSSRDRDDFANRMLAALRREFGGHAVKAARKAAAGKE